MTALGRRDFLASGIAAAGILALGPNFWQSAFAAPTTVGDSPYGPLGEPDQYGIQVPAGFTVREVARGRQVVTGTSYTWHTASDGQATFSEPDGGWILVSNSETVAQLGGGCSAIRFAPDGTIRGAYRICGDTSTNCSGGPSPWGTWLTCEEQAGGHVWECDPLGRFRAVNRPALGTFTHEAIAVDPVERRLYMTEDTPDGGFYRFTPPGYPDLREGVLEIARVGEGGATTWAAVPDPTAVSKPTRQQVEGAATFQGGEGIWFDSGTVYFSTKRDHTLWAYEVATATLSTLYDPATTTDSGFLRGPDNLTVSRSGDLFVCEDNGEASFDVVMVTPERTLSSFLRVSGPTHKASELAGVTFSPDGSRLYFASQRANAGLVGAIYEVSGPFRPAREGWAQTPAVSTKTGLGDQPMVDPDSVPKGPGPKPTVPVTEDVDAPKLRLTAPARISLAKLRKEGVTVAIRTDEAATLTVTLRTSELGTVKGPRGSQPKPTLVTLDKDKLAAAKPGTVKVRLRISATEARRVERVIDRHLRKGNKGLVKTRISVQARDAAGNTSIANRRVVITTPVTAKAKAKARK